MQKNAVTRFPCDLRRGDVVPVYTRIEGEFDDLLSVEYVEYGTEGMMVVTGHLLLRNVGTIVPFGADLVVTLWNV